MTKMGIEFKTGGAAANNATTGRVQSVCEVFIPLRDGGNAIVRANLRLLCTKCKAQVCPKGYVHPKYETDRMCENAKKKFLFFKKQYLLLPFKSLATFFAKEAFILCESEVKKSFMNGCFYGVLVNEIVTKFQSTTRISRYAAAIADFTCLLYGSICHNLICGHVSPLFLFEKNVNS